MIPQLRSQQDGGGAAAPTETIKREPDEDPSLDMLDAVAEDLLAAVKKGDKALLKGALEALVTHIQMADVAQDEGMA